jgi:hypothetical protein
MDPLQIDIDKEFENLNRQFNFRHVSRPPRVTLTDPEKLVELPNRFIFNDEYLREIEKSKKELERKSRTAKLIKNLIDEDPSMQATLQEGQSRGKRMLEIIEEEIQLPKDVHYVNNFLPIKIRHNSREFKEAFFKRILVQCQVAYYDARNSGETTCFKFFDKSVEIFNDYFNHCLLPKNDEGNIYSFKVKIFNNSRSVVLVRGKLNDWKQAYPDLSIRIHRKDYFALKTETTIVKKDKKICYVFGNSEEEIPQYMISKPADWNKEDGENSEKSAEKNWIRLHFFDFWHNHPLHAVCYGHYFEPSNPLANVMIPGEFKDTETLQKMINVWSGFQIYASKEVFNAEPLKRGIFELLPGTFPNLRDRKTKKVDAIIQHIHKVFCGGIKEYTDFFLKWFAHLFKFPNKKPRVAITLQGEQGTGKGGFFEKLFRPSLGRHFLHIQNDKQNSDPFDGPDDKTALVKLFDEITLTQKMYDNIKNLISSEVKNVREMFMPVEFYQNYIRVIHSTNATGKFIHIERSDRRFVVFKIPEVVDGKEKWWKDRNYWETLYDWAIQDKSGNVTDDKVYEGLQGFIEYLLSIPEVTPDYNFELARPITDVYVEQKMESMNLMERWLYEIILRKDLKFDFKTGSSNIFRQPQPNGADIVIDNSYYPTKMEFIRGADGNFTERIVKTPISIETLYNYYLTYLETIDTKNKTYNRQRFKTFLSEYLEITRDGNHVLFELPEKELEKFQKKWELETTPKTEVCNYQWIPRDLEQLERDIETLNRTVFFDPDATQPISSPEFIFDHSSDEENEQQQEETLPPSSLSTASCSTKKKLQMNRKQNLLDTNDDDSTSSNRKRPRRNVKKPQKYTPPLSPDI